MRTITLAIMSLLAVISVSAQTQKIDWNKVAKVVYNVPSVKAGMAEGFTYSMYCEVTPESAMLGKQEGEAAKAVRCDYKTKRFKKFIGELKSNAAILNALYYVLFFYDFNKYSDYIVSLVQNTVGSGTFSVDASTNIMMLAMPALSIFCLIMAMRGVIYDIALLKSLERLR